MRVSSSVRSPMRADGSTFWKSRSGRLPEHLLSPGRQCPLALFSREFRLYLVDGLVQVSSRCRCDQRIAHAMASQAQVFHSRRLSSTSSDSNPRGHWTHQQTQALSVVSLIQLEQIGPDTGLLEFLGQCEAVYGRSPGVPANTHATSLSW
jgi:hypothetical protein